ncbi:hypothetical protein OEZ86_006118 [Tetradesmus obliquus]|nr:hypothetical protein OEZ86_006118 [Tetradesmus obliquus]
MAHMSESKHFRSAHQSAQEEAHKPDTRAGTKAQSAGNKRRHTDAEEQATCNGSEVPASPSAAAAATAAAEDSEATCQVT